MTLEEIMQTEWWQRSPEELNSMGVLEQQKLANENRMRNAMSSLDFGMIRQEPSMADRALGVARRMFWGENDPRKASLLNQGVLLPDGSRGIPMKGAPKRFESVMDVVGGPLTFAGRMAKTAKGMLAKDFGSRMARAKDMGYGVDAYHGSTRDISEFTNKYGNPEGHYGGDVHYFTNSPDDLGKNYAGEGPDLTSRIESKMERVADEGIEPSRREARKALGIENKGVSYPVKLKMQNPVKTHGKDETFFDYQAKWDDDPASDYYEEFIGEEGKFVDLIDETKGAMWDWDVASQRDDVLAKLQEANMDMEGITASQFEDVIRNNVFDVYHPQTGELASSGDMIADIYKRMGYDGVEMDAYKAFGPQKIEGYANKFRTKGMEGLDQDTRHYIAFEPHQIRSKFAEFDPKKAKSGNILAGVGGTAIALPVLSDRER